MDDSFDKLYRKEEKMMSIFAYFSILSIVISSLGLFALVSFTLEQRVKEIGIRKVMGANLKDIILVVGKDFLILIGLAALFAIPAAGYGMNQWLQDFANRISLQWWMFGLGFLIILIIAVVTLISKILPAANANPVVSLRTE